ncbi:MAG TPA: 16S rRNA (adenine(1518)-N(6)/adenine(1519)-N(6))-dimethyltransferase RsmA [bacterium]|nr:16S rRNA (adenine(1518)-N(6)/adenine(1519)-N(6))-dimethyltransferase RsmA [bacterium]HOL35495.1 16S rRNA (adenine(1518)-N(6)/adenine(1519)-N(6))-dimethyltransferase RsmA [bacterium]HPP08956.1 16S rRNA (adenine(1518)-N(6)/adenine(1519)-N(6))-dimethyltransferase RsmA [bacterium]
MDTLLTIKQLQQILASHKIFPKKQLGQNFLIDRNIRDKIISFAGITKNDIVVEIGPGLGALTGTIAEKAKFVYGFEKDRKLVKILLNMVSNLPNVFIEEKDFLELDEGFFRKFENKIKIIGNLPYYVASPILFKFLEIRDYWQLAVVMIPEEVAIRIIAKPGDKNFGLMAVLFSLLTNCSICYKVRGSVFYPEPEINSVVMKILSREKPTIDIKNLEAFWKILPKLYMQRRKTILNVVSNSFKLDKKIAASVVQKAGIQPSLRSHQIEIDKMLTLVERISEIKNR